MALSELTIQLIAFRVLAMLILSGLHGGIIAGTAVLLGDKGPKYDGRLTGMPTSHVDFFGGISLILFGLGWAKPVDVDQGELRTGRAGVLVVLLAGFSGLLLTAALLDALVLPALTTLSYSAGLTAGAFLRASSELAIWMALLSLVPIPPLAAGMLAGAVGLRIPPKLKWILAAVLIAAIASGVARDLLEPGYRVLSPLVLGD